jgi:hypothetical protein
MKNHATQITLHYPTLSDQVCCDGNIERLILIFVFGRYQLLTGPFHAGLKGHMRELKKGYSTTRDGFPSNFFSSCWSASIKYLRAKYLNKRQQQFDHGVKIIPSCHSKNPRRYKPLGRSLLL